MCCFHEMTQILWVDCLQGMSVPLTDERDWIITAIHVLENEHATQPVVVTAILYDTSLFSLSLSSLKRKKMILFLHQNLRKFLYTTSFTLLPSPIVAWLVGSLFSSLLYHLLILPKQPTNRGTGALGTSLPVFHARSAMPACTIPPQPAKQGQEQQQQQQQQQQEHHLHAVCSFLESEPAVLLSLLLFREKAPHRGGSNLDLLGPALLRSSTGAAQPAEGPSRAKVSDAPKNGSKELQVVRSVGRTRYARTDSPAKARCELHRNRQVFTEVRRHGVISIVRRVFLVRPPREARLAKWCGRMERNSLLQLLARSKSAADWSQIIKSASLLFWYLPRGGWLVVPLAQYWLNIDIFGI